VGRTPGNFAEGPTDTPDAENRISGDVKGRRGAIPITRLDRIMQQCLRLQICAAGTRGKPDRNLLAKRLAALSAGELALALAVEARFVSIKCGHGNLSVAEFRRRRIPLSRVRERFDTLVWL
jgi:hypothetical protein